MKVEELKLPNIDLQLSYLTQENFSRGVITLIDESKLPKNALREAQNIMLVEDGVPRPRWGTDWYGTAPSASEIDGAFLYETSAQVPHLVAVAGGTVYRSTDNGENWDTCTGASFTSGYKVYAEQAASYLYLVNGENNIIRYDGSTTLQSYTALSTPGAPTTAKTGLASTTYTYYYKIVAVNAVGSTAAGSAGSIQVSRRRTAFDSSNFVTLTWAAVTGATRYDIYVSESATGDYYYLDYAMGLVYEDNGTAQMSPYSIAPDQNTTTGPKLGDITMVGARLWGTQDKDNPWRVWFSGAGANFGNFAAGDIGGGYVDLQKGSQYRPVKVADYRDGKGTPLATVWCESKDGQGAIWQISLATVSLGDVGAYTEASPYRLPGSRGTNAPASVVNVLNDFFYYNSQAFYNLGSRAQFLNLLSTDEASANIRPTVKEITTSASDKIAGFYFDAKLFMSVPYGEDENNYTIVYDTERKAWIPKAFTLGFERFFQYTDSDGEQHLLAWKPGDTRLTEISQSIQGDYGVAFDTSLVTGLIYVTKNRFEFMWVEEAEVEFSQPKGSVNIELIGIERTRGFRSLGTTTVQPRTTNVGHSTFLHSTTLHSDTTQVAETYSESSVKRYFRVQKELNAYQFRITTGSLDADYVLRTLQVNGTATLAGKPRQWRID